MVSEALPALFDGPPDLEKLLLEAGAAPKLSFGYTFARARRRSSVG
jgi:hypothetical protein